MSKVVLCPVCNGSGKYNRPNPNYSVSSTAIRMIEETCHGCNGKGWVEIGREQATNENYDPNKPFVDFNIRGGIGGAGNLLGDYFF